VTLTSNLNAKKDVRERKIRVRQKEKGMKKRKERE
jgi:hypothetical protein